TPDVQKANADLLQAQQAYDRTDTLFKRTLVPQQMLDDAATTLQSKRASYDLALQNAKNLRASIQASEASMKLADRQLRDTESGKIDDVLTLPYSALQYRYGVNRVFVIADDKLAARELKVGERVGDRIEIISGVQAGERVAANEVDKLVDGMPVKTGKKTE